MYSRECQETREGWNCRFQKLPHREGWVKVQGSVDPRFAALLPFPVPEIPESKSSWRFGIFFSRNFPATFPEFSSGTPKIPKTAIAFSEFSKNGVNEWTVRPWLPSEYVNGQNEPSCFGKSTWMKRKSMNHSPVNRESECWPPKHPHFEVLPCVRKMLHDRKLFQWINCDNALRLLYCIHFYWI